MGNKWWMKLNWWHLVGHLSCRHMMVVWFIHSTFNPEGWSFKSQPLSTMKYLDFHSKTSWEIACFHWPVITTSANTNSKHSAKKRLFESISPWHTGSCNRKNGAKHNNIPPSVDELEWFDGQYGCNDVIHVVSSAADDHKTINLPTNKDQSTLIRNNRKNGVSGASK